MSTETKTIKDDNGIIITIDLLFDKEEGCWMIEEEVDTQTYDEYENAKADFDLIVDWSSLKKVFGWKE